MTDAAAGAVVVPGSVFLSGADWVVIGLYFATLVVTGVLLSRRQGDTTDYYLAGRRMPAWAVSISVLATALSAATFIGCPDFSYGRNLTYLVPSLGLIIASVIVALFFLPAFYGLGVTTVYDLLQHRFGPGARTAGSAAFMMGRLLASGARIYIAAHALSWILFRDIDHVPALIGAVWILSAAGVLYTIAGGIATVIWTDVVQTIVFLGAIVAAVIVLATSIDLPAAEVVAFLRGEDKLVVIDLSMDPRSAYTLWTGVFAFSLFHIAAFGTDQDMVQRMLTCRTRRRAGASMIASALISLPVTLLFLLIGLLLYVRHQHPSPGGGVAPAGESEGVKVFLRAITTDMPPGLGGLMVAGLFAAGLSSLDSALNALSSTLVNDIYARLRPGRDRSHDLRVARLALAGWGVALGLVATLCVFWQRAAGGTLIDFALSVMTYAYAGLLGVFVTALFTRRGSTASVVCALVVGASAVLLTEPFLWRVWFADAAAPSYPWRFVVATVCAGLACMAGRGRVSSPGGGV